MQVLVRLENGAEIGEMPETEGSRLGPGFARSARPESSHLVNNIHPTRDWLLKLRPTTHFDTTW